MARNFMGCLGTKEKNLVRKQTPLGMRFMVVFICVLCVPLLKAHAVSDVSYSFYITEQMCVFVRVCVYYSYMTSSSAHKKCCSQPIYVHNFQVKWDFNQKCRTGLDFIHQDMIGSWEMSLYSKWLAEKSWKKWRMWCQVSRKVLMKNWENKLVFLCNNWWSLYEKTRNTYWVIRVKFSFMLTLFYYFKWFVHFFSFFFSMSFCHLSYETGVFVSFRIIVCVWLVCWFLPMVLWRAAQILTVSTNTCLCSPNSDNSGLHFILRCPCYSVITHLSTE